MFTWSLTAAPPFFISRSAASTSHDTTSGASFGPMSMMVLCSLSHSSVYNSSIRSMILFRSWISQPCLSRRVISLSWPSFCVFQTFFRLFDAMIVSRIISWLYFLMFSLAFVLMVLHISAYSIHCLSSPFSTISRCFIFRARSGDHILEFNGLLIDLATLDALCWIMSVMVSLIVSMSSSFFNVWNRFFNSNWHSIFFDLISVASTLRGLVVIIVFLSTSTSSLTLLISIMWSLPTLTWLMTVTSVTMSGLFVRMQSISVFVAPFGLFHVHLLPAYF